MKCIFCPPLPSDIPGNGVPSDHMTVHATPIKDSCPQPRSAMIKTRRPLTTQSKLSLASWVQYESWKEVLQKDDSRSMVDSFTSMVEQKI